MILKRSLALMLLIAVAACGTLPREEADDAPYRTGWFEQQYERDTRNQAEQARRDYMTWVDRFYRGMNVVPGWLKMSERVLEKTPPEQHAEVDERLERLGRQIGAEWAKDNGVRLISTRMVNIWRQALEEAVSQDELLSYLRQLESDVDALLKEELLAEDIYFERYFEDEFA